MNSYRTPRDAAALAHNFLHFADVDCGGEPLYATLSRSIARDPGALELLMEAPLAQRRPVLLFAAVHDLLLAGTKDELARFYATTTARASGEVDAAAAPFARFCAEHRAALSTTLRSRATQTNEVGRSAGLRVALGHLAPDRPVALVDVGCSAGLNLFVDRYRHRYLRPDGTAIEAGPRSARAIETALRPGSAPFALGDPPPIAARHGIDRSPLDLRDGRDRRWLRACVWPSDAERHRRLDAALAIAATGSFEFHAGDATDVLDATLASIDRSLRPVVFHSWAVSYFDAVRRDRLVAIVRRTVEARDGAWISAESAGVVPGLDAPAPAGDASAAWSEATLWHVTTRAGTKLVARAHPHGAWLEPSA